MLLPYQPRAACPERSEGKARGSRVAEVPLGKRGHPTFDPSDDLLDARPSATLDLHGFTGAEASSAVRALLETWRRRQPGAVLHIITGKGKGSAGAPVLRGMVKTLLQGELREFVAEWSRDEAEGGYKVRVR